MGVRKNDKQTPTSRAQFYPLINEILQLSKLTEYLPLNSQNFEYIQDDKSYVRTPEARNTVKSNFMPTRFSISALQLYS